MISHCIRDVDPAAVNGDTARIIEGNSGPHAIGHPKPWCPHHYATVASICNINVTRGIYNDPMGFTEVAQTVTFIPACNCSPQLSRRIPEDHSVILSICNVNASVGTDGNSFRPMEQMIFVSGRVCYPCKDFLCQRAIDVACPLFDSVSEVIGNVYVTFVIDRYSRVMSITICDCCKIRSVQL